MLKVREGSKAKRRSPPKTAARIADAENSNLSLRNDLVPLLQIEFCPTDSLKSHGRKLRKSNPAHIDEVAQSMRRLGFNVPLLIGKGNVVIDGDQGWKPQSRSGWCRCRVSASITWTKSSSVCSEWPSIAWVKKALGTSTS
jgi:hypothetical protein